MEQAQAQAQAQADKVAVVMVPFAAQGHLNQMLQLSCLISSYGLPVSYVGSALHNRQAKARINGLSPQHVLKIEFHDIVTPPFASPPPDPTSANKFPSQLQPAWDATLILRRPVAAYLQDMAARFKRVVVVHDPLMAFVIQDVASILNSESYAFNCASAFSQVAFIWNNNQGKSFPVEHPKELLPFETIVSDEAACLFALQIEALSYRTGDIYNTCRFIEAPYVEVLEREEVSGNKKIWAIGPMLPAISSSSSSNRHKCLEWLDKQEPDSVIYVSFGTTVSLSDEQINELAHGLEQSKVKFLWVLRDADKGDVFDGEVRRAELPEGFEERVGAEGLMVVRDWAPQPQILAHASTGAFMSHCGWNSCLESITMGVPIAAWPMHSDQPLNAALATDILKVSVAVREWNQRIDCEVVKASTIESVVRRLMASSEGDEIRKRAEELGTAVRLAAQPGGASRLELDSFVAHITR